MRIAVANVKGGAGKTTSAVYLAAVGAISGLGPVVLVDADPQGSAAEWMEEQPVEDVVVMEAPSERLVVRAAGEPGAGLVVIDTPPGTERIVRAAIGAADLVVIPTRSGGVEPRRVAATRELVPAGLPHGLVICAARTGTRNLDETRSGWAEAGLSIWGIVPERVGIEAGPAGGTLRRTGLLAYEAVLEAASDAYGAKL